MRRNLTASAALSSATVVESQNHGSGADPHLNAPASTMRRNTSVSTLSDLRRREQQSGSQAMAGSRSAVVEAVACQLLELVVGKEAMLEAMREATAPERASQDARDGGRGGGVDGAASAAATAAHVGDTIGGKSGGGSSGGSGVASPPRGIAASLQGYILTIVRHLELPNSCIIAALIYVLRAVSSSHFTLSLTNWQPCLLASFVIAAKLSFDEPVWNEDFVKALRISNVQVSQISRWEADFLQLLSFNTNVTVPQYAAACFDLQKAHEALHGKQCHFFTYLMSCTADL